MDGVKITRRSFVEGVAATTALVATSVGQARKPSRERSFDVGIYGATPAGVAAAVTAARLGLTVVLIEWEDHIGGIIVNGLTNTDLRPQFRNAVGGFFNEFTDQIIAHYTEVDGGNSDGPNAKATRNGFGYEPSVAEAIYNNMVASQKDRITLMLEHEITKSEVKGGRVVAVEVAPRGADGTRASIAAKVFIDATYEGDLAAMSGASFRLGRESRAEFNEPHAGVIYMKFGTATPFPGSTGEGDQGIQSYCFRFTATTNPTNRVLPEKPEGYNRDDYHWLLEDIKSGKITKLEHVFGLFPMPCDKVEFNSLHPLPTTGVPSESLDLAEECWPWPEASHRQRAVIYQRYLTHNVGMFWMLQNDPEMPESLRTDTRRYGWCKDEFASNKHVPRQVYVREGRRINGEYLLTEHDGELAEGWQRTAVRTDSIGIVEWEFDSHACHRFDPEHPGTREGYTFVPHAPLQVPYGVVVPRTLDGLLVPVACSATHIAYNALRMEPVFAVLGETCARAAHLAIRKDVALRSIPVGVLQRDIAENNGVLTYFEDLQPGDENYAALHWVGARGFNLGYRADAKARITVGDAKQRVARVLKQVGTASKSEDHAEIADDASHLTVAGARELFAEKGISFPETSAADSEQIDVGKLAGLMYQALDKA